MFHTITNYLVHKQENVQLKKATSLRAQVPTIFIEKGIRDLLADLFLGKER